ncbi:MAG: hypothetical protein R3F60_17015 [bacterium]
MRDDMDKLLGGRTRGGTRHRNPEVRTARTQDRAVAAHEAWDEVPRRARIRPDVPRQEDKRQNLQPLVRFLRSRCGRPWDRVYAELCRGLEFHSAGRLRTFHFLRFLVAQDAADIPPRASLFYVHPTSRVLLEVPRRRRPPPAPSPDHFRAPDGRFYARYGGLWWQVELAATPPIPRGYELPDFVDALLREPVCQENADVRGHLYGRRDRYATARRPVSRKTLKALGLWRT